MATSSLESVDGFIEEGSLHEVHRELLETERLVEATWGEYLKLSARRDALRARAEALATQLAREVTRPLLNERLRYQPPKVTSTCRACGRPLKGKVDIYCARCFAEVSISNAIEEASEA